MASARVTITGAAKLDRALKALGSKANRVGAGAVTAAAKPIIKAARANVPTQSGLLKKSLGSVMRRYTGTSVAVIGARSSVSGEYKGRKRLPVKYSHLVEFGTVHSAPKPFLRPAFDAKNGESLRILNSELRKRIIKAGGSV